MNFRNLVALWLNCFLVLSTASGQNRSDAPHALAIVIDGLRPEYATPAIMPRLAALTDEGFTGLNHHAVFPTVTRVNAASIATGSYPMTHGLMGNSMYVPDADAERVLSTGEKADLELMERGYYGRLLTAPTLSEILAGHDRVLFAASSGSSGSGYLLNHRLGKGALVHPDYVLPRSLEADVEERIGPGPQETEHPFFGAIRWAIDAVLEIGIDSLQADAVLLWITEPDGTAHTNGVGSPEAIAALQGVDREIGRLLDELAARNLNLNLFVTADHGFSSHIGDRSLTDLLVESGLKESAGSTDVVVADGAIHVRTNRELLLPRIVQRLQETPGFGPIFTRNGEQGTLPFASVFWAHDRSADILTSYDWSDASNAFGYPGAVMQPGVAGHGSTSPFDIRTFFAMHGPAVKSGATSDVPSGNVDIAPTILHLLGLPQAPSMDGRVLSEALAGGPESESVAVMQETTTARIDRGNMGYEVELHRSRVESQVYVDFTRVRRW